MFYQIIVNVICFLKGLKNKQTWLVYFLDLLNLTILPRDYYILCYQLQFTLNLVQGKMYNMWQPPNIKKNPFLHDITLKK